MVEEFRAVAVMEVYKISDLETFARDGQMGQP